MTLSGGSRCTEDYATRFPQGLTEQALREGECQQLVAEQIGPDLFTLVRHADAYASWRSKSTVFDSTGCALQDHVALDVILEAAKSCGVGDYIELQTRPSDALNPYKLADRIAVFDRGQGGGHHPHASMSRSSFAYCGGASSVFAQKRCSICLVCRFESAWP